MRSGFGDGSLSVDVFRVATELRREVANHSRLKHQNIIILMGIVFELGNYGVILEYAPHGDLWHFIRKFCPVRCTRVIIGKIRYILAYKPTIFG